MADTLAQLVARVQAELDTDLAALTNATEIGVNLNAGLSRLPARYQKTASITWLANAATVDLPADFIKLDAFLDTVGTGLPAHRIWNLKIVFLDPAGAAGGGTVHYFAHYPTMDGSHASLAPVQGDEAIVSYALYRFFRKISGSRADFRKYVSITGQSGLEVSDLDAVAERYRQDFVETRAELEEGDLAEPAAFFGS